MVNDIKSWGFVRTRQRKKTNSYILYIVYDVDEDFKIGDSLGLASQFER